MIRTLILKLPGTLFTTKVHHVMRSQRPDHFNQGPGKAEHYRVTLIRNAGGIRLEVQHFDNKADALSSAHRTHANAVANWPAELPSDDELTAELTVTATFERMDLEALLSAATIAEHSEYSPEGRRNLQNAAARVQAILDY